MEDKGTLSTVLNTDGLNQRKKEYTRAWLKSDVTKLL